MTEAEGRAAVVAEAITWLRTPYHHRAKLKRIGVDCAQLVLAIYENVGLVPPFDTGDYPPDWHLHREVERYLAIIRRLAGEITRDQVQPGDVVLFRFGRAFSHGAIVTTWPQIVHASRPDGAVILGDLDGDVGLKARERMYFSFWAKAS